MKTTIITASLSILFVLASCDAPSNETNFASSDSSSSLDEGGVAYYFKNLKNQSYYSIGLVFSLKQKDVTYEDGIVNDVINTNEKIEHHYKRVKKLSDLENNQERTIIREETYETADKSYVYDANDGTFHENSATRSDFLPYSLVYDYSLANDCLLETKGYVATITGRITKENLPAFGEKSLPNVEDFSFSLTLTKKEGTLQNFGFSYSANGFSIIRSYEVSTIPTSISLP